MGVLAAPQANLGACNPSIVLQHAAIHEGRVFPSASRGPAASATTSCAHSQLSSNESIPVGFCQSLLESSATLRAVVSNRQQVIKCRTAGMQAVPHIANIAQRLWLNLFCPCPISPPLFSLVRQLRTPCPVGGARPITASQTPKCSHAPLHHTSFFSSSSSRPASLSTPPHSREQVLLISSHHLQLRSLLTQVILFTG